MKKITVLIADDHTLFRQGLKSLLETEENIEFLGYAENGQKSLEMVAALQPDLLILDISMPVLNGFQVARRLRENSDIKIIMLTVHNDPQHLKSALELNINGYVLKEDAFEDLLTAIKKVLDGELYISPALEKVYKHLKRTDDSDFVSNHFLTLREEEILRLIARGMTNKQIAAKLQISIRTVETHRSNIMRKFNLTTSAQLIKLAMEFYYEYSTF